MIQQILLFSISASGFLFWLAALVSRCAAKLRRTKPHLYRECVESSSDSESWCQRASVGNCHGTEFNVRWAVQKKKKRKKDKLLSQGLPHKQMTLCPSFWDFSWLTFFFSISSQWCCSDSSAPSVREPAKRSFCTPAFSLRAFYYLSLNPFDLIAACRPRPESHFVVAASGCFAELKIESVFIPPSAQSEVAFAAKPCRKDDIDVAKKRGVGITDSCGVPAECFVFFYLPWSSDITSTASSLLPFCLSRPQISGPYDKEVSWNKGEKTFSFDKVWFSL